MKNIKDTIISQYANSPIICNLIKHINSSIDPTKDLNLFYDMVLNLNTAKGAGLDFWGEMVGIEREILVNTENTFFGSSIAAGDLKILKNGYTYRMNDELYRAMIFMKAYSNIIYCTAYFINRFCEILFNKRGEVYFVKNGTMQARYVFNFNLTEVEKAILISINLLPRPTGVLVDIYEPKTDKTFGFIEAGFAPFGEGSFYIGDSV